MKIWTDSSLGFLQTFLYMSQLKGWPLEEEGPKKARSPSPAWWKFQTPQQPSSLSSWPSSSRSPASAPHVALPMQIQAWSESDDDFQMWPQLPVWLTAILDPASLKSLDWPKDGITAPQNKWHLPHWIIGRITGVNVHTESTWHIAGHK